MLHLASIFRRAAASLAVLLLVAGLILPILIPSKVGAGLVTSRSLKLSSSANGNVSTNSSGTDVCALTTFANPQGGCGAKAKHTVTFTLDTNNATIGSMLIMYCTSPILQDTCTTPSGLTAANLTSVTVTGLNGAQTFSLDTTTNNDDLNNIAAIDNNGQCNVDAATTTRENCVPMVRASAVAETGKPTAVIAYGGGTSNYIKNPTTDKITEVCEH